MIRRIDLHNHLAPANEIHNLNLSCVLDHISSRLGPGGIMGLVNFPRVSMRNKDRFGEFAKHAKNVCDYKDRALYFPKQELWVFKGQEVPIIEKVGNKEYEVHLLAIGLPNEIHLPYQKPSLEKVIVESQEVGAILIADHPSGKSGIQTLIKKDRAFARLLLPHLDAWKIFNSNAWLLNKSAEKFYHEAISLYPGIGALAGSDGHSVTEVGKSYTELSGIYLDRTISGIEAKRRLKLAIRNNTSFQGKKSYSFLHPIVHQLKKYEQPIRRKLESQYYMQSASV